MSRIYIVEDDITLRNELKELLENSGYDADALEDFEHSKEKILASDADLLLLDINIPHLNGQMLLREIRKSSDMPVIMVTSRSSESDEVLSMSYGADDYITKPYNPTILLLRISAILKRSQRKDTTLSYMGLNVDPAKGCISNSSTEIVLTKNEMIIFRHMLDNRGNIVTRDELMTELWDNEEFVNDNALTVNISRLRTKLADAGLENVIETRKKQGYILK